MGPKTAYLLFNSNFGNLILKRHQTEHNFEILLIKWKFMRFCWSIQNFKPEEKYTNSNLNNMIRPAERKTEIFEKVVNVKNIFLVIYFTDEVTRITYEKFQTKLLNIVEVENFEDGSRFDILIGRC